jgi:hypothetical protein
MMQKPEICFLPKSLFAAKAEGNNLYYTGIPCKHGHDTYRYVADRACSTCVKLKVKKAATIGKGNARRWAAKTEEQKDIIYGKRKIYYEKTKEIRRTEKMRSHAKLKNNKEYVEQKTLASNKWKQNNIGKVRANTVKRRLAKMQRTPAWLKEEDYWMIDQAYELAALRTKMFNFSWHVDHILPLQGKEISGLHVIGNLQVIPWIENIKKANKLLPA